VPSLTHGAAPPRWSAKRWFDGVLVDNPNAEWRIDEATRDELQDIISQGLSDNIGSDAIAQAVEDAGAFSEERAGLIADTEIASATARARSRLPCRARGRGCGEEGLAGRC